LWDPTQVQIYKVSQGVPGAVEVICQLLVKKGFTILYLLDDMNLRGSAIYIAWKYFNYDIQRLCDGLDDRAEEMIAYINSKMQQDWDGHLEEWMQAKAKGAGRERVLRLSKLSTRSKLLALLMSDGSSVIVGLCVHILEYGHEDLGLPGEEFLKMLDDMNLFGNVLMAVYLSYCKCGLYTLYSLVRSKHPEMIKWARKKFPLVVKGGGASVFPLLNKIKNYEEMYQELLISTKDLNPFDHAMIILRRKEKTLEFK